MSCPRTDSSSPGSIPGPIPASPLSVRISSTEPPADRELHAAALIPGWFQRPDVTHQPQVNLHFSRGV